MHTRGRSRNDNRRRRAAAVTLPRAVAVGGGLAVAATLLSGAVAQAEPVISTIEVQSTGGGAAASSAASTDYGSGETLADAITFANDASNGVSQITFASDLSGDTITISNPLPAITRALQIEGPGADELTINGGGHTVYSPVFQISSGVSGTTTISGLTVTNGDSPEAGAHFSVGGGGVLSYSAVQLDGDEITGNTSVGEGGGIWVGYGGSLSLQDSTVSGNSGLSGGGLVILEGGASTITNSTIADNTTTGWGGGIMSWEGYGLTVTDSTITGNQARSVLRGDTGDYYGAGGILAAFGSITLDNSIVADNSASTGVPGQQLLVYGGGYGFAEFSLIGDDDDTARGGHLYTDATDIRGTVPSPLSAKLGTLGSHGGPTETMLPLAGSPAIDAGNAYGLAGDQRGDPRGVNYLSGTLPSGGDGSDIGAVELQKATVTPAVTGLSPSSGQVGDTITISGAGLWKASAVSVGGTSASFVQLDPGTIEATVPAGATSGDVRVTVGANQSPEVAADLFTVYTMPSVSGLSSPSGVAGSTVTLTGSGFTGASAVDFGSMPATSYTVDSDTQITATVPDGDGSGDVTVTGPAGTSSTVSGDMFAFVPGVTGLSPASVHPGAQVTVTGTDLASASSVGFAGGVAATSLVTDAQDQLVVRVPAGAKSGDVTVTTPDGTSATDSSDRLTIVPVTTTPRTRTLTTRFDNQRLTLTYPNIAVAPAEKLSLKFRASAITGSKAVKLRFRHVDFWVDRGVKHTRRVHRKVHGKRRTVTVTTHLPNATRNHASDSLAIALKPLRLSAGRHTLRAVVTYTRSVVVHHHKRTRTVSKTIRVKFRVS